MLKTSQQRAQEIPTWTQGKTKQELFYPYLSGGSGKTQENPPETGHSSKPSNTLRQQQPGSWISLGSETLWGSTFKPAWSFCLLFKRSWYPETPPPLEGPNLSLSSHIYRCLISLMNERCTSMASRETDVNESGNSLVQLIKPINSVGGTFLKRFCNGEAQTSELDRL